MDGRRNKSKITLQDIENTKAVNLFTDSNLKFSNDISSFTDARLILYPLDTKVKYLSNGISTSKYSLLTWAPKSLIEQFKRVANIYFLAISILSAQYFSPKNPFSMAGTFGAVLVFTMLKEAYEDFFRHKQDNLTNSALYKRLNQSTGAVETVKSKDIKVGDILYIENGEYFPADLIFLSSSHLKGLGFVNTMNLDGEVNLKEKSAVECTRGLNSLDLLYTQKFYVECDQPNISLVKWNCNFMLNDNEKVPLSMKQLLLRGCTLQNTDYVHGLVIYTGHESKIMLNSKQAPSKSSNVLKKMNKILYTVFLFQFSLCLLLAGLSIKWEENNITEHAYLNQSLSNLGFAYFIQVLTYLVAYSHLIPISLYVALEVLKLVLAYLISQDLEMYHDGKSTSCRSSDLVEELGSVEFIFSDKTGTLTSNEMEFRKCEVNGIVYGDTKKTFGLEGTDELLAVTDSSHPEHAKMNTFFEFMAVCHSVFPAADPVTGKTILQASSPDELALVQASKSVGIEFYERTENSLIVKNNKTQETVSWELLVEIPFNSDRKRMSVIVKNSKSNQYILMTKGADTMMLPLIKDSIKKNTLDKSLYKFAVEGLRTLVMGQRVLSKSEFDLWHNKWRNVLLSNDPTKEQLLDSLGAEIEVGLELVGCSAIEDKLQDGVPQAIQLLMSAGIRLWVLTGDKEETAIEIGKSCNLIQPRMELIKLSSSSEKEIKNKIEKYSIHYKLDKSSFAELEKTKKRLPRKTALVVDGITLSWIIENKTLKILFFKLGFLSSSCICCRVSPAQKMQVVQMAKSNGKWITLSIGDGANDVSMIQEAHIGIGISGKEGAQAVQAADFSFTQFRFLTKLLLVHGRWAYKRISWFICYYFYKNITVVFAELWFAMFNGFSGQIYFLDWLPMLYNSFWTSWPCMVAYLFEQDVSAQGSLKYPGLYAAGQKGLYFSIKVFWVWVIQGIYHGAICFWVPILYTSIAIDSQGIIPHLWWVSTLSFSLVINIVTLKLFLENTHWNFYSM
jgi:phospholipid-transporting ATPase